MLPLVLASAFLVRASLGLSTQAIVHPDAIFQYLEQGHRLAFGNGIIPWEYVYGIRSWIIAGFIAIILKGLGAVGLDSPFIYQPVIKLVFCAISLVLPLSAYRIAQSLLDETAARVALLASSFWYEIVYYAHTPLPDALAAYALFGALAYMLQAPRTSTVLAFGALAGLTIALRYQLAPTVVVAGGIAAIRWRWHALPAFAAFAVVLALSGALDAYTWGIWFGSIVLNLELNLFADVAGEFSRSPPYAYLGALAFTSLGLAYVGSVGLLLSWRRTWPLLAVGFTILIVFSIAAHKETRFIFAFTPVYLIGIAALITHAPVSVVQSSPIPRAAKFFFIPVVLGLVIATTVVNTVGRSPNQNDLFSAYLMLSGRDDVGGLIDQSGTRWFLSGGYYHLHLQVPIYRWDMPATKIATVLESPSRFATHWITTVDSPPSPDYVLLERIGTLSVWQRMTGPSQVKVPPGYSTNTPPPFPAFDEIAPPPRAKPRW